MLIMLFLLFCLSNVSLVNSEETDTKDMLAYANKMTVYNKVLVDKLGERVREAYHHWDGIPVLSPIKMRNIRYISSDYGHRRHPIYLKWAMHHGIDFSARQGTTVYNTAEGVVTKVKRSKMGYGNQIYITHSDGYCTRYAHLDEIFVKEGQRICAQSYIGTVGNTGISTGPHLHYEILYNNRPIDPMYFTYASMKERSVSKYFKSLIALESQQNVDNNLTLGMYYKFTTDTQVISSSKIN